MKITINDNIFKIKLAVTPQNIQQGMMGRKFNDEFNAMFFMLNKNDTHCFWTYKCVIPLDIMFIDGNTITKIHHSCEPCKDKNDCISYCGEGNKVLEIKGGSCEELGINEGDSVSFSII